MIIFYVINSYLSIFIFHRTSFYKKKHHFIVYKSYYFIFLHIIVKNNQMFSIMSDKNSKKIIFISLTLLMNKI